MFEGQPQVELEALMKANTEFRQLYHRHKELDKQVLDAELGVLPVDEEAGAAHARRSGRRAARADPGISDACGRTCA